MLAELVVDGIHGLRKGRFFLPVLLCGKVVLIWFAQELDEVFRL